MRGGFTESQNPSMAGVGSDLYGSSSPIPLCTRGLLWGVFPPGGAQVRGEGWLEGQGERAGTAQAPCTGSAVPFPAAGATGWLRASLQEESLQRDTGTVPLLRGSGHGEGALRHSHGREVAVFHLAGGIPSHPHP